MKAKKILALAAISLMGLTACGENVSGGDKFVITVSARNYDAEKQMLRLWEKGYEDKHPNVDVKVDAWGGEDNSEAYIMNHALNRSSMTNIIYTTDDTTSYIANLKNLVDLRPYYEADPETDYSKYYSSMLDTTSFYGEFRPTTSYNGAYEYTKTEDDDDPQYGIYFAPREYNMPALLCNVTLFKDYLATDEEKANWNSSSLLNLWKRLGESDEWTWSTFVKALQSISSFIYQKVDVERNTKFFSYRSIFFNNSWEPTYTTFNKELGGDGLFTINELGETVQNMRSEKNVATYERLIDDFADNKPETKYLNISVNGSQEFGKKTVFSAIVSYPEVGNYYNSFKNTNYELGALPLPCEYVGAGCGGYAILTDKANARANDGIQTLSDGTSAKTVDLCWDFIKYTISEEGQNLAGKEGLIQPILKSLADDGDWCSSYEGTIDSNAFCAGKELRLDTFSFAAPKTRGKLRSSVAKFYSMLFRPDTTGYNDALNTCVTEINTALKEN